MHDLEAARIFWKEWRAQRSFWLGLFGLAVGLEFLLIVVSPLWRPVNPLDQVRMYQALVIVLACSFATGSAAIAFAGEVESKTKGLLQRIPLRPRDLLAGKLSLALVGSYALLVAVWLVGGLMLLQFTRPVASPVLSPHVLREIASFWRFLLAPVAFIAVGSVFSLVLSDVLLTVIIAGLSTSVLMAVPAIRDHLAIQGVALALLLACNFFLARRWLQDGGATQWAVMPRVTMPRVMMPRVPMLRPASKASALGSARSAVAWRRAAGSLIWKEFRQAYPFCVKLLVAGLFALVISLLSGRPGWIKDAGWFGDMGMLPIVLIVVAPLLTGVAAMRPERKDRNFRLLANHGVVPEGFLLCKHLVWLSLSLAVFELLLLIDLSFRTGASPARSSLWDLAAGAAEVTFESAHTSVMVPLATAAFHVVLLYALGFLLGLLLPGAIVAFFAGVIVWLAFVICWSLVVYLRIPFSWTIGLLPVLFLAVAWVRTPDWLIGRKTLSATCKAAAVFVLPLLAIAAGTIVYRITEIPAVTVPQVVLESGPASVPGAPGRADESVFVAALDALSDSPPIDTNSPEHKRIVDGWQYATPADQAWVAKNAAARKLALEAARRPPGSFRAAQGNDRDVRVAWLVNMRRIWSLSQLLLYSARELESQGHLDSAFACYVAVARLGRDAAPYGPLSPAVINNGYSSMALNWMQLWAAQKGQTAESIKKAIGQFEALEPSPGSLQDAVLKNWRIDRRELRKVLWESPSPQAVNRSVAELRWTRWLMPWELVRMERLDDAVYAANVDESDAIDGDLRNRGFVTMTAERADRWNHESASPWKYWRTTLEWPESLPFFSRFWNPEEYVDGLATVRMQLIALAIAGYKHEHHKRPDSLQQMVPDYFKELPIDPWTGIDFVYEPLAKPIEVHWLNTQAVVRVSLPFLASAGMSDSRLVRRLTMVNGKPSFEVVSRFTFAETPRLRKPNAVFPGPLVWLR